jgi:hypothetical protein
VSFVVNILGFSVMRDLGDSAPHPAFFQFLLKTKLEPQIDARVVRA